MIKSRRSKKILITFAKTCVALFLFYLILRGLDIKKFVGNLRNVELSFCLLVCLLYPINLMVSSGRLKYLLHGYHLTIRVKKAFDLNWIAGFFNNFLPTSIGGDIYRVLYLNRQYPGQPAQVVSSIMLDRGLGLLAMLILACLTSPVFIGTLMRDTWLTAVLYSGALLVTAVTLFVLFSNHNFRLPRRSRVDLINRLTNGFNILINYPDKKSLTNALLTSFLYTIVMVLSYYLLFRAFHNDISFLTLLFVIPIVSLAGLVPISVNALGITEGVGIILFSQLGFEPELILSILLTGRVLLTLCSATGGTLLLFRRNEWLPAKRRL